MNIIDEVLEKLTFQLGFEPIKWMNLVVQHENLFWTTYSKLDEANGVELQHCEKIFISRDTCNLCNNKLDGN